MNRREWLRRAALIAAGAVAGDQLEIIERLTHRRRFWPGADLQPSTFDLQPSPFGPKDWDDTVVVFDDDAHWGSARIVAVQPNGTLTLEWLGR